MRFNIRFKNKLIYQVLQVDTVIIAVILQIVINVQIIKHVSVATTANIYIKTNAFQIALP